MNNILRGYNREQFRKWLADNHSLETECWIAELQRGKPLDSKSFYYLDAVEEALCFGWIDSVYKKVNGILYQRFSPRRKNSHWTILNIARIKRLQSLGLMTDEGLKYLPKTEYIPDKSVISDIKKAGIYDTFIKLPTLYQHIRISLLYSQKKQSQELYNKALKTLVEYTKNGKFIGQWNDYGRLS